jgi:predicted acyltransferase
MVSDVADKPLTEQIFAKGDALRQPAAAPAVSAGPSKPERLMSLDAYRGFIMLVMASGGLGFVQVAKQFSGDPFWQILGHQFDHVLWRGCTFWDLIQPSFIFMVGVAMPYSFASRRAKGHSAWRNLGHVLWRSFVLIALAIFLSSNNESNTRFIFTNVLAQIGLGYSFVYLFLGRGLRAQLSGICAILFLYWLATVLYPLPGPDFDYASVGVRSDAEVLPGFFGHWTKNTNLAAAFDSWFLNLFPPRGTFTFNSGGYQTLNFIPSMATMLFGLMAGEWLRSDRPARLKLRWLLAGGAICLVLGFMLSLTVCPSIKRLWTPSWAIFSAGWAFYMLAAFYWIIDFEGHKRWAFPLVVVGMNSIAMYCMSQLMKPWVHQTLATHFGKEVFTGTYGPIWESLGTLAVFWLFCWWLYRRQFFIRI